MVEPTRALEPLVEVRRGEVLESLHLGHAAVCGPDGAVLDGWGDPHATILPRSSCKMIQAIPLAARADLPAERLALACASHQGAAIHVRGVEAWLSEMGLDEAALGCGAQPPRDREEAARVGPSGASQLHNNCSGKHAGFLMLSGLLDAGTEGYLERSHPAQRAVLAAFEEAVGEAPRAVVTDGCSAPNPSCTLAGLARGMARFAVARDGPEARLRDAMIAHPELVAGEGRACTELMRAMDGVAVKTGAEGVFAAIVPARGVGVAVKVADGATRAAECAVAAILARLGALDPAHPLVRRPVVNWRGITTGDVRPAPALAP